MEICNNFFLVFDGFLIIVLFPRNKFAFLFTNKSILSGCWVKQALAGLSILGTSQSICFPAEQKPPCLHMFLSSLQKIKCGRSTDKLSYAWLRATNTEHTLGSVKSQIKTRTANPIILLSAALDQTVTSWYKWSKWLQVPWPVR